MIKRCLFAVFCLLWTLSAEAHKPSDSYLTLKVVGSSIEGQWDIALRDLDFAIGLDSNSDGEITWRELRARHAEIDAYALARLALSDESKACPAYMTDHLVDHHSDGAYAVLRFTADCGHAPNAIDAAYSLFFDIDPQHKGLLRLEYKGATRTAIFSPETGKQHFVLAEASAVTQFLDYGREGVWHIWIGFDHILFLLSLLLPAVLVYYNKAWRAATSFRQAFIDVLKIVTAFTVAHSITLSLATFGVLAVPTRIAESAIAASVVLAALNNVFPLFQGRRWMVAFFFGLIHGFGFASVLADLGLPQGALLLALVGFNLGVEAGQLAIVSVFLPVAYVLRRTWLYQRLIFIAGSLGIALVAAIWLVERVFNLKVLPF